MGGRGANSGSSEISRAINDGKTIRINKKGSVEPAEFKYENNKVYVKSDTFRSGDEWVEHPTFDKKGLRDHLNQMQKEGFKITVGEKWDTVYTGGNKSYQRKLVREIVDNDGNRFTIYQLTNKHNELDIRIKGKGIQTLRGSRKKIINEIGKYWKGKGSMKILQ